MATTIAVSGKGGSGKTTVAAMIIRALIERGAGESILAVDADPNCCLAMTLGVESSGTIAEIRERASTKRPTNAGMDRLRTFEYGIQQAITEAKGFDLLTMGRPEGPGCYCAANNMLRQFMDKLSSQYKYVIIDNEAGMEHLSRRTTNNVDLLLILASATSIDVVTAKRITELADELSIAVKEKGVVWNRTDSPPERESELDEVKTFGCVPADESVLGASMAGKNIFDLNMDSPAFLAVCKILDDKLERIKT
ncbi:MAG: AAA family ATPase [Sedimentisphaerales bacterium]|nr:AAA family ATPase [Sedimentisphaerales bacterium]